MECTECNGSGDLADKHGQLHDCYVCNGTGLAQLISERELKNDWLERVGDEQRNERGNREK